MKKLKYFVMMTALLLALGACKKEKNKPKENLAELTTSSVWNIGVSTAASGGNISSDGGTPITARGVCYSSSPNPTIDKSHTTDGTGTGIYSSQLTGLAPSTPYYARAYATNGAGTAYGQQVQFVTQMAATIVSISPLLVKVCEEITFTIKGANMTDGMSCVVEDLEGVPGQEQYPVIEVTWYGAKAFAEWADGRLPTEAEWEYAGRGGAQSQGYAYSGSDNIDAVVWYFNNSGRNIHVVGTKSPNELGIYDMSGNVLEWCNDW